VNEKECACVLNVNTLYTTCPHPCRTSMAAHPDAPKWFGAHPVAARASPHSLGESLPITHRPDLVHICPATHPTASFRLLHMLLAFPSSDQKDKKRINKRSKIRSQDQTHPAAARASIVAASCGNVKAPTLCCAAAVRLSHTAASVTPRSARATAAAAKCNGWNQLL
jgi:hypothetical protein